MPCTTNVLQGRTMVFSIKKADGSVFEVIGGVTNINSEFTNTTVDVTNQNTTGSYSEKQFNGYSEATISCDYFADTREGGTHPDTSYTIVGDRKSVV